MQYVLRHEVSDQRSRQQDSLRQGSLALGYGCLMDRIDFLGKNVSDLGVSIPGRPTLHCGFSYGVRFPGKRQGTRGQPFSSPATEPVNADTDPAADMLVLLPDEFDTTNEALAVIVNERCLRKDRLIEELQHLSSTSPDSPSVRVYVPERKPGHVHLGQMVQRRVDEASICADVYSYYP